MSSTPPSGGRVPVELINRAMHKVLVVAILLILKIFIIFLIHIRV